MAIQGYEFGGGPSAGPRLARILALLLLSSGVVLTACGSDETQSTDRWETEEGADGDEELEDGEEEFDGELPDPTNEPPSHIVAIETVLHSPSPMRAGETLNVECRFLDVLGEPIAFAEGETPNSRVIRYPDDAFVRQGAELVAQRAGRVELKCQSTSLGLTDPNPVEVIIEPGPVHTTTLELDRNQMVAGENAEARCEAFDVYGNPIDDASFQIVSDTTTPGLAINQGAKSISATSAGLYTFSCHSEGVQNLFGESLDVIPDLPAELLVALVPNQSIYSTGQVITLAALVQDRFGNEIPDARIAFSSAPQGENFGSGRFRFHENGVYTLRAEVDEPTRDDIPLIEEMEVIVNDSGPSIVCTAPYDGEMVDHAPGANLTVGGVASDVFGVSEVLVNGAPANLDSEGAFSAVIQPRYGINFVDIVARDIYDEESVRTCAFLVSNNWAAPSDFINDAVTLRLSQDAIDDGDFDGVNIRSLNDLILVVINSEGLRKQISDSLRAGNPYDPDTCNFDMYVNDVYFGSVGHSTSLELIGGGLRMRARFNEIHISMTLKDGSWYCFGPYNPTVILDYVEIDLTAHLLLSGNLPTFQLGEVERVESGEVSAEGGNWFSSFVYDSITSLFQGTFRGIVEDTFESAITENFDQLFSDLIGSLDIDSLGGTIDVPRLDSDDAIGLNFGFQFSYANANSLRALFGIAPRIVPADGAAHGITTKGVAHPAGAIRDAPTGSTAGAAVHISLLNQALHSLWRAGLLHADIGSALFGDNVPDGTAVSLEALLPPLAVLDQGSNTASIHLGGLRLSILYPGIFDEPVALSLGATATTQVNLDGDEISFDNIQLDEFHLSPEEISLNEGARDILEDFLQGLIQEVVDQSLNAALPALPIPSFTIPPSMAEYNLPVGADFGVVDPSMTQTNRHLMLRGEFGIR